MCLSPTPKTPRLRRLWPWLLALLLLPMACDSSPEPTEPDDGTGPGLQVETVETIDTAPAWSPDGQWIAYTHYPRSEEERRLGAGEQIWLLRVDDPSERRFVTTGWLPAWHPDSLLLAFVRRGQVWRIDLNTGQEQQLTDQGRNQNPSWSPTGAYIAYESNQPDGKCCTTWLMTEEGTQNRQVTPFEDGGGLYPYWAPDGEQIVHVRYPTSANSQELFVMDTTNTTIHQLTQDERTDRRPEWSRDGQWIAWDSYGEGKDSTNGIWKMRADGTEAQLIAPGGGFPTWHPDGDQLAFYKFCADGIHGVLWTVQADGTGLKPLTKPSDYAATDSVACL